jgi:hypothetical protein
MVIVYHVMTVILFKIKIADLGNQITMEYNLINFHLIIYVINGKPIIVFNAQLVLILIL